MKQSVWWLLLFLYFYCIDFFLVKNECKYIIQRSASKISKKRLEGLKNFIEKNNYFPVIDTNENNATPLLLAIKNKNIDDIKLFLEKGASLDELDHSDSDAIDYCLLYYDYDITSYLVE